MNYVWVNNKECNFQEGFLSFPFTCTQIVPGMGQWILVHTETSLDKLPKNVVSSKQLQQKLNEMVSP